MVVEAYHGSKRPVDVFALSLQGSFGAGIYLADQQAAQLYGEVVMRAQVTLDNPYYYAASFDHDVDLDSAAVALVRALFAPARAEALLERARHNPQGPYFGEEVPLTLRNLGHDGLVVTYDDGSQEIIAFAAEQIRVLEICEPLLESPSFGFG